MSRLLSTPELLRRLVAVPSVSAGDDGALADLIRDYLDRPGIEVHGLPGAAGKRNLHVRLGPAAATDGRRGLTLSGHLDVVPAEEPDWRSDPFRLADLGDRWAGRGTCDMKGFLAVALNLARRFEAETLRAPLVLLLTRDEELGSLGAQELVAAWPDELVLPRVTVVGEPTTLQVVRLHKGHLRLRLTLRGRPAHSGYPHRGQSAIEPAGRAITALAELGRELATESPPSAHHFPDVPYVALNIGRVRGGEAVNVIPGECTIDLGLRLLPGTEAAALLERIRLAVEAVVDPSTWTLEVVNDSPPLRLPATAAAHRELCRLTAQRGDRAVGFSSDAGTLQRLGLECVLFGPGSIEVAHRANEFLPKEELARCEEVLSRWIAERCLEAPGEATG